MSNIRYINKFSGYTNFMDVTNMPVNMLAAGSQNVFIEDGSRLEPRAGMAYWGVAGTAGTQTDPYWTLAHRIHSKYDEFVNKQGVKIPLRIFYEGTTAKGDVIEVWLPTFVAGVAQTTKQWYQITATTPTLPLVSTHRYYFAEWFDQALAVIQPELIFTYGATKIGNWSGGFAPVTAVTPTTITTNGIWTTKGFIGSPEGTNIITVNGVEYTVTAGFGTNTVTVASTAGVSVNDVAFQNIYFNDTLSGATTYDVCSAINNQAYYIDWNQRNVYISWNRNQIASLSTTIFTGVGLDDGIFSGTYTGSVINRYKVVINTVNPDISEQVFTSTGLNGLNNGLFVTSGYSGTAGATNVYKILVIGDMTLALDNSTIVGSYSLGETVRGSVSNARGLIVKIFPAIQPGIDALVIDLLSGNFIITDIITGNSSGATATLAVNGVSGQDWIQYYKNDILTTITSGSITGTLVPISTTLTTTLTDGLSITWGNYFGHAVGDTFQLTIREGGIDTFQWNENGGVLSASTPITGATQLLSSGVSIKFDALNGHTIGDAWTVTATQKIERGWSNFTYDNPNRLPGQGFNILLDSNGWTMKPQEKTMLVNAQAGHFYDVTTKLSSDLLSESVEVVRLKSEPLNKVLFPYLINYIKNQLATISSEKTFDVLGRQKFLELQQSKTISDAVRIDFATVDWTDADVLYFKRKIFFNIPRTTATGAGAAIFIFDDYKKYWHTPQIFGKRISLLSVIDDKLIGHSYEQNESYELFTGMNDLGVFPIKTKMVFPYDSSGNRFVEKSMSAIGFEGYIKGAPVINYTINSGVGGCEAKYENTIRPQDTRIGLCIPTDTASLGKSGLGFHGLGNDPVDVIPHFFYIKPFDNLRYYQRNIELECSSPEQRWSIISLGTDLNSALVNNEGITDPN